MVVKKHFSIVIYFLSAILVLILSLFVYRIITHISYLRQDDKITLSKYTGERINSNSSLIPSKIATYINPNYDSSIVGLSSADVVLEFLSSSYGITYKAIYSQEAAENVSPKINLKEYSSSWLPKFNFSNDTLTSDTKGENATSIFITFNEDSSSNFLYEYGEYYHFRGLNVDKDDDAYVKLSNVIVQFIHGSITHDETLTSSENQGTGLLFSNGKSQDIEWTRENNSAVKISDKVGDPVSLAPGPTWWIFIDKDCSVAYD
jgi:hypothetical protein